MEKAFPRMQAKSRTTFVRALGTLRRNTNLRDQEKEKVFALLGSVAFKKHIAEAGITREITPVAAPPIPTTNLEIPVPLVAAEDLSKVRVSAFSKSSRFSVNSK